MATGPLHKLFLLPAAPSSGKPSLLPDKIGLLSLLQLAGLVSLLSTRSAVSLHPLLSVGFPGAGAGPPAHDGVLKKGLLEFLFVGRVN